MENAELQFTSLSCWTKSRVLMNYIFSMMENCNNYNIRNQIERASISVLNNIAEGYTRISNKEKIRFFEISASSCSEIACMSFILFDRKICKEEEAVQIQKNLLKSENYFMV
jgi:four helix bundle protein